MLLLVSSEKASAAFIFGSFALGLSVLYASKKKYSLQNLLQNLITRIEIISECINERLNRWRYLTDAPRMIQEGYDKAKGGIFVIRAPDVGHTFVSDKTLIKEIDTAPDSVLSLQAAAKRVLQPQFSMQKFNWFEQRGIDGTPLVRTLRSLLTNNLPSILPESRLANAAIFDDMFNMPGKKPHFSAMVREAVSHTNALAFFGDDLARDKDFLNAALDFTEKTVIIAEVVRILPAFLAPHVGRMLGALFTSQTLIYETLVPVAEQRLAEREQARFGHKVPEHKDCIQWVMELSSKTKPWSAERIIHEMMALWFGAVHAMNMSINFAIHDLCLHPEYVEPLRREFEGPEYQVFEATGNGLPLLDSFLKESLRLTPLDSLSTRRQALQPFHLSDGTYIERGQWICTPSRAMMRDPRNYERALEFHGFRHVDPAVLESLDQLEEFESPEPGKALPLTDVTAWHWQVWGTGRMACPGRFYAVAGIKQIVGLVLTKYDLELVDKEVSRSSSWRNCHLPSSRTPIVLHPRVVSG